MAFALAAVGLAGARLVRADEDAAEAAEQLAPQAPAPEPVPAPESRQVRRARKREEAKCRQRWAQPSNSGRPRRFRRRA